MNHTKYGELAPDDIIDIFYERIGKIISGEDTTDTIENWLKRIIRVNGKIPDVIQILVRDNKLNHLLE
jgi:hypothetical protein